MADDQTSSDPAKSPAAALPLAGPAKVLSEAAKRALAEAEERRRAREAGAAPAAPEVGGRNGPDPARYGDWEKGGIASDF
jgi:hypothetical protein